MPKKHRHSKLREPRWLSWISYIGLRALLAVYGLIPARRAYGLGAGLVSALYPLFPGRRRVAVDNLLKSGITDDRKTADRIARKAFGHFAGHLCEAVKVGKVVTPENWREHVIFDGPESARKLLFENTGLPVMLVTGHLGVWEAAGTILSYVRPMMAVARPMNNPYIERYLKQHHFRGTVTIISKKRGFTPDVIREWQQSKAALTLVMDQHASKKQGVVVDFLGRPASTHTSPARLHLTTGVPMLVGAFIREAPFRYRVFAGEPLTVTRTGDRERDTVATVAEINRQLGEIIRRYPEQYLWAHRRWREK